MLSEFYHSMLHCATLCYSVSHSDNLKETIFVFAWLACIRVTPFVSAWHKTPFSSDCQAREEGDKEGEEEEAEDWWLLDQVRLCRTW
jgi:hypothetical protein